LFLELLTGPDHLEHLDFLVHLVGPADLGYLEGLPDQWLQYHLECLKLLVFQQFLVIPGAQVVHSSQVYPEYLMTR